MVMNVSSQMPDLVVIVNEFASTCGHAIFAVPYQRTGIRHKNPVRISQIGLSGLVRGAPSCGSLCMNLAIFNIFLARLLAGSMPSKSASLGADGSRGMVWDLISAFRFGAGRLGPLRWADIFGAHKGDAARNITAKVLARFLKCCRFATLICTWDMVKGSEF